MWEMVEMRDTTSSSFFLDVLFIQVRVEDTPISDDEPTIVEEDPPQREAHQHQNRHRNTQCHHEAKEWEHTQPVSQDKVSEAGETPHDRAFHERRNS